jgi:hypothetical protein
VADLLRGVVRVIAAVIVERLDQSGTGGQCGLA